MTEYRIRRKPGSLLRVDDLDAECVDGYWDYERGEWFDLGWLYND